MDKDNEKNYDDGTPDYHYICTIDTPQEERERMYIGDIYINAAICKKCNEEVRSKNKHDYRCCSCRNVCVDGGSHYAKRTFKTLDFESIIVKFSDTAGDREEVE